MNGAVLVQDGPKYALKSKRFPLEQTDKFNVELNFLTESFVLDIINFENLRTTWAFDLEACKPWLYVILYRVSIYSWVTIFIEFMVQKLR